MRLNFLTCSIDELLYLNKTGVSIKMLKLNKFPKACQGKKDPVIFEDLTQSKTDRLILLLSPSLA